MKDTKCVSASFQEKSNFNKINDIPLYELFHKNSELNSLNKYTFSNGILKALYDREFKCECSTFRSLYNEEETINLPDPNLNLTNLNLFEVILNRRSVRNFTGESINLEELSTILFYSSGVTGEYDELGDKSHMNLLAYPSAGGLIPLDLYILIHNVEGIRSGIYYYNPMKHYLKLINTCKSYDKHDNLTLSYNLTIKACLTIYILGNMRLTGYKYGDRGYRFMTLEAGHLAQNLYLTSTAIGAGAVASGGFLDVEILDLLSLSNKDNFVLYEIIIGKPNLNADYRFLPK